MLSLKKCGKCHVIKDIEQFGKCKGRPDGRHPTCKECRREYARQNRDKIAEYKRSYYLNNKDKILESQKMRYSLGLGTHREYRIKNRDRISKYNRLYRSSNIEKCRELNFKWKQNNLDRVRIIEARRRVRISGNAIESLPSDFWQTMLEFYGERCMVPGCTNIELTLDHIIPVSKGGAHAIDNFQILCKSHNSSKGARHSTDYRPSLHLLIN